MNISLIEGGGGIQCFLRKEMVDNVCLDDAVEEISANEAKVTINGRESTLDKGPVLGIKMREVGMCVMKVGNGD